MMNGPKSGSSIGVVMAPTKQRVPRGRSMLTNGAQSNPAVTVTTMRSRELAAASSCFCASSAAVGARRQEAPWRKARGAGRAAHGVSRHHKVVGAHLLRVLLLVRGRGDGRDAAAARPRELDGHVAQSADAHHANAVA